MHRVCDRARLLIRKPFARGGCCLLFRALDWHLGIRPVSRLNTQPMVSPVNASRRSSRDGAHHSGPERLAKPYSAEDFHLLSFASLPGARGLGSSTASRRALITTAHHSEAADHGMKFPHKLPVVDWQEGANKLRSLLINKSRFRRQASSFWWQ